MDTPISALGPGLSMLPAVAVVDAIRGSSGGAIVPGIKWVNDLLVEGRKVAGVLTATRIQGATVQLVVMGAGINLERAPALEWTPFVPEADCLGRLPGGESISPADLLSQLLNALARRLSALIEAGPGELLQAYRHNSLVLGRRVMIWQEGSGPPAPPSHRGIVESIGEDLSLHLRGGGPAVTSGRLAYASVMKARP